MSETSARPLGRTTWRRARFWVILVAVVAVGAVAITALTSSAGRPLDPNSAAHDGSKALAQLLRQRGTAVSVATSPADAAAVAAATTVLISDPDDLGADQLGRLASTHRVVLVAPDIAALAAVTTAYRRDDVAGVDPVPPGCSWAGALATGPVTFPDATLTYSGPSTCYDGAVVVGDRVAIVGSAAILRNDQLAGNDVAALDLNLISNDGAVASVTWLLPGVDDTGSGSPSIWALFPPWAQHAFWWLLVVGVLAAFWRGRRLGPVVTEPLPVVVRSAEVVEGHGRLYLRAGARDRAARLLRSATATRLAGRLGLDRRAGIVEIAAAVAGPVLVGAAPSDDRGLLELARDLDRLEKGNVPR